MVLLLLNAIPSWIFLINIDIYFTRTDYDIFIDCVPSILIKFLALIISAKFF